MRHLSAICGGLSEAWLVGAGAFLWAEVVAYRPLGCRKLLVVAVVGLVVAEVSPVFLVRWVQLSRLAEPRKVHLDGLGVVPVVLVSRAVLHVVGGWVGLGLGCG